MKNWATLHPGKEPAETGSELLKDTPSALINAGVFGAFASDGQTMMEFRARFGPNPALIVTKLGFSFGEINRGYGGVPAVSYATIVDRISRRKSKGSR